MRPFLTVAIAGLTTLFSCAQQSPATDKIKKDNRDDNRKYYTNNGIKHKCDMNKVFNIIYKWEKGAISNNKKNEIWYLVNIF